MFITSTHTHVHTICAGLFIKSEFFNGDNALDRLQHGEGGGGGEVEGGEVVHTIYAGLKSIWVFCLFDINYNHACICSVHIFHEFVHTT